MSCLAPDSNSFRLTENSLRGAKQRCFAFIFYFFNYFSPSRCCFPSLQLQSLQHFLWSWSVPLLQAEPISCVYTDSLLIAFQNSLSSSFSVISCKSNSSRLQSAGASSVNKLYLKYKIQYCMCSGCASGTSADEDSLLCWTLAELLLKASLSHFPCPPKPTELAASVSSSGEYIRTREKTTLGCTHNCPNHPASWAMKQLLFLCWRKCFLFQARPKLLCRRETAKSEEENWIFVIMKYGRGYQVYDIPSCCAQER